MLKTVVKYLFLLGMIFLGSQGRALAAPSGITASAHDRHVQAISQPELFSPLPGQLCFTHSPAEESYLPLFIEEQWEEEEEFSGSPTWMFTGALPALFFPSMHSGHYHSREQLSCNRFEFAGTARCRYLLFRVFRI